MNALSGFVSTVAGIGSRFLPVLLACALKASLVSAAVYAATRLMTNSSPQPRHLLWLSAIGSYPLILALSLGRPLLLLGGWSVFHSRTSEVAFCMLFPSAGLGEAPLFPVQAGAQAAGGSAATGCQTPVWPAAILLLWAAGILVSFARILIGRLQMLRMIAAFRRGEAGRALPAPAGTARRVRIVASPLCRVPFTCRLLQPVIVLPTAMCRWRGERRRAVLLHELRHIRRGDAVIQPLAYAVCCLFWFVPFIWAAFARLQLEQEKSCDWGVVAQGVKREVYAGCIVEAARLSRKLPMPAGLRFAGRRKRLLADRVRDILRGGRPRGRGWTAFVAAALLVCALVVLGGAGRSKALSGEEFWERLLGTWVNATYAGLQEPQMMMIKAGFLGEDWRFIQDGERDAEWRATVKKVWTNWRGELYCQYFWRYTEKYPWTGMGLMRVRRSGRVLEMLSRKGLENGAYPTLIDRRARSCEKDWYCIYYLR